MDEKELFTHLIDIKTTQATHTEQFISINKSIDDIKAQCPVENKRIESLENSRIWFKGAFAAIWLIFIVITTILAIYLG